MGSVKLTFGPFVFLVVWWKPQLTLDIFGYEYAWIWQPYMLSVLILMGHYIHYGRLRGLTTAILPAGCMVVDYSILMG